MIRLLALLFALALSGGCAHTKKKSDLEALRPVVESFHQRVRWKDYRIAARYIIPERRQDFEKARRERQDERDLSITDYEIEEVQLDEKGERATVTSRIKWMRLPSVSEQSDTVTSEFIFRDGKWLLERQLGGPFDGELP
ncbi:hypothetical protein [Archangium sp.]|uniref:hypothetical protein n=1 Tax=Archangium sp. TaxID=1872627 RepID=UPI002D70C817|nr:hypothetical protein [Archangium sp.]HYO58303.1 hypothetical protein [Archangium sp.]